MATTLSDTERQALHAYWRAANYLSVGQIYLLDNPLLTEPLALTHIKPRLLGHWRTTPGLNFIYVHLNRVIKKYDLNMIYVAGPGHGGPGIVANTYLEGTYSEVYPHISQDTAGLKRLFKQFSFPGGIPSHVTPETPGSIHEGGELGYAVSHAYGAAFDNPDLIVACVVGDGEAETGPLAAAWHSNKFLNPVTDGAVLPILHLNGYKIANPTVLARINHEELHNLFLGYGYTPHFVEGDNPEVMHERMAHTLETVIADIHDIQHNARAKGVTQRPHWPMIILRSPKGWTGPQEIDGKQTEGSWRSHQVPLAELAAKPEHVTVLEAWLKSYRPEELFEVTGKLRPELAALAPRGARRMGANLHANGGMLLKPLLMPDFRSYAVAVLQPGTVVAEATRVLGGFLRDVMQQNLTTRNFRVFGPDETNSNRLNALGISIAHLGNGASMAALRDGQPFDTTMGLTPTGGFMMGTRSGDLDPGILLHLMQAHQYGARRIAQLVNDGAGLLGVSGSSADMKVLLEIRAHDPAAAQAVEMFCYQVRKQIGALTAVLGGLDALVFTGGIGERAAAVRWEVCAPLAYLGIRLDSQRNAAHADWISATDSQCAVRVIPTREDLMIARHTRALVFPQEHSA